MCSSFVDLHKRYVTLERCNICPHLKTQVTLGKLNLPNDNPRICYYVEP